MRKKIDGSKKYETVHRIGAGEISIRHAAEILGVHPSSVQARVRLYEVEGMSGFVQQKDRVYSEALKTKAVEDYLSGKQTRVHNRCFTATGAFNTRIAHSIASSKRQK